MNIPMSWLKEYVDLDCDINTFAHEMTMSGSNVEGVEVLGKEIKNVIVGQILSIDKHPNADKLVVSKVDIGTEKPLTIVTGATNIQVSDYIPVAVDGAELADDKKINKGELRGIMSEGMMCSIEELGYTKHDYPEAPEHGIYIFQNPQKLGADVVPILELCDDVVEFELTSNRSDCFSVLGIAREAAATFDKPLQYPETALKETAAGKIEDMIAVEILNKELCPRYIARVVKNVKIGPSPQWLRHRLTASGLRPINNIVDITNYVMLEIGQPMHAFDIDFIANKKIIVRNANDGETFTTLDGVERKLDSSMLVIADSDKAVAIAGVMGGENSKVTENATAILFESANFNGPNNRRTSKKIGLRTDASSKYEKGLDPNLAELAVNRAMYLVELLGCGEVVKGMVDCYPNRREPKEILYSAESINKLLGTDISQEDMVKYLKRVEIFSENHIAKIPTFRPDMEIEADIAEEVARMYGYDKINTTLAASSTVGKKSFTQTVEDQIKDTLVSFGLCEALHYSFESPKSFESLLIEEGSDLRKTVTIVNPLGIDFSIMRTTTLNAMLTSLATNYNRRNEEAMLFEIGSIYLPKSLPLTEQPDERKTLTIGLYGKKDFFDIKGMLEVLFDVLKIKGIDFTPEKSLGFMHPGRTAAIKINETGLGFVGQVHPNVLENYNIGMDTFAAVIDLQILFEHTDPTKSYVPLPKFPGVQRDIAINVKDEILVKEIELAIKEKAGDLFESIQLFDVYKGSQIQEGYKSVAYNISFRAADRTLKDEEVSSIMKHIVANLEEKLGAKLR